MSTTTSSTTSSFHTTCDPNANMNTNYFMGKNPFGSMRQLFLDWIDKDLMHWTLSNGKDILYYKPPVGMVTIFRVWRLFFTGRILKLYSDNNNSINNINNNILHEDDDGTGIPGTQQKSTAADRVLHASEQYQIGNGKSNRRRRRRRKLQRAHDLDKYDLAYSIQGGVESVRSSLCDAYLQQSLSECSSLLDNMHTNSNIHNDIVRGQEHTQQSLQRLQLQQVLALAAIRVTYATTSRSREDRRANYVSEIANHVISLEESLEGSESTTTAGSSSTFRTTMHPKTKTAETTSTATMMILQMSQLVLEIRVLDALLRISRDRLLTTCLRLKRLVSHWNGRVYLSTVMGRWVVVPFAASSTQQQQQKQQQVRANRIMLALAEGAYQTEMDLLGRIVRVLLLQKSPNHENGSGPAYAAAAVGEARRPMELSKTHLVEALQLSSRTYCSSNDTSSSTKAIPWFHRLAIRWNAEGKGQFSIRFLEQDACITKEAAQYILLEEQQQQQQHNLGSSDTISTRWMQDAQLWIDTARKTLCEVVQESIKKDLLDHPIQTIGDTAKANYNKNSTTIHTHMSNVIKWCSPSSFTAATMTTTTTGKDNSKTSKARMARTKEQWQSVLELVEHLDDYTRVGEGTATSLVDSKITKWLKALDIFGVPSSMLLIGCAHLIHPILKPRWPLLQAWLREAYLVVSTILERKVWSPLYDIVLHLISRKNTSLLEFFNITNEVTSLDNMLRDLGFGDGTESTRQEALAMASRRYELDLVGGTHSLLRSAVVGRLPRLLLVQVQQLKAGLLHALDGIDALVAANRLNVQLLAAIPAVLILTLVLRFVVRSISTVRLKAIRSVRDVHSEMSDYLHDLEKSVLWLGGTSTTTIANRAGSNMELGSFVLTMHSYLILLDYSSSPLVPARLLDGIHKSMQDLLVSCHDDYDQRDASVSGGGGGGGVDPDGDIYRRRLDRQVQIVRLLKEKHQSLVAYL